jgi:flagellar hook-basal body protein
MAYGIGLSGLMSAAEAIDVTSNNISNAQTIGYKSGEYVFSDQFFRAQDPQSVDRAGMGAYRMAIRRPGGYGTIVGSQNPLDMAITGPGMFQLAKNVDGTVPTENPTKFQYTRNGQFAVDNQNRIVNQNGMFLVGYPADASGTIISSAKSVMVLDQTPLAQQATKNSTINLNLDNRLEPITNKTFNKTEPTSYSQSTSQTVYDDKGMAHTLSVYYKKVNSADLVLTGDATGSTFTFNPQQSLLTTQKGEQTGLIATTSKPIASPAPTLQTISNGVLTYVSGGSELLGSEIGTIGGVTGGSGYTNGTYTDVVLSGGSGTGAKGTVVIAGGIVTSATLTATGVGYKQGDFLTIDPSIIGNGSGFSVPVSTLVTNRIGTLAAVSAAGSGYTVGQVVNLVGGAGTSGATGTVTSINGTGGVTGIALTTPGSGFTAGQLLAITATAGAATGATVAVSSLRAGVKTLATVTPGAGYTDGIYHDVPLTAATEQADITIGAGGLTNTQSLTIAGLTFTATTTVTQAQLGAAFASLTAGATTGPSTLGTYSGTLTGFNTSALSASNVITATSATANQNVNNLAITVAGSGSGAASSVQITEGTSGGAGAGAKASIVISNGVVTSVTLTDGGTGYLATDTFGISANSVGGTGSGFRVAIGDVNALAATGNGTKGATYNLKLKDGTNLSVTQITESGSGAPQYTVNVDRYAVFTTLDGNPVGQNATSAGLTKVKIGGVLTDEQTSLGTVAFVGGKNIDSLSRDAFGMPQFETQFKIDASGGKGSGWGQTNNEGVVQFTLNSTNMTGYSSAGQTYANNQDGSATSQLASYNVDSSGRLTAQYDNGTSVVKGQVLLAYFNNIEGLIPNGNNTYEASQASGNALLSFPGDGNLGAIRSKALEQSNVDLTSELVKLMVLQRQYSAVSQATKVMATTLIDEAINIGR